MSLKRVTTILVIVGLLGSGVLVPRSARASTEEDLMWAGVGLTAYVAVVVIATVLVYRTAAVDEATVPIVDSLRRDPPPALRYGRSCGQRGGQLALLCW